MQSSKIKRTESARPIYWLLGIITIAGVVFVCLSQEDSTIKLRADVKLSGEERAVVNSFSRWNEGASVSNMGINHDLTADGLMKMADALEVVSKAVSERVGKKSRSKIDTINKIAVALMADPVSSQHTDMLKIAFQTAEDVLHLMQSRTFPELANEMERLDREISMIKSDKLLLEQKNEIIKVYHQIAIILKAMSSVQSEKQPPSITSRQGLNGQKSSILQVLSHEKLEFETVKHLDNSLKSPILYKSGHV